RSLTDVVLERYADRPFVVFAGPGNNGGDALAMARMLRAAGNQADVWLIAPGGILSLDCRANFERLEGVNVVDDNFVMPAVEPDAVIIDGLFGSGLNRPVEGVFASVIKGVDALDNEVVAVDMPSGLLGENNDPAVQLIVFATLTVTLQFPKLSLLFAENAPFVGELKVVDIGLSKEAMENTPSKLFLTDEKEIKPLLKHREKFAHKGNFGQALLVAGSQGMAGASVLAACGALRSGVGLLTVHLPHCNNIVVQTAVPEAMTSIDSCITHFSDEIDTERYSVVAVGPGLGQNKESEKALLHLIDNCEVPMVLDADALNILSRNPQYLQRLPQGSVITPHVGEFNRLFGKTNNSYIRLMASLAYAKSFGVTIVLKGAYTVVTSPCGVHYFNTTGNPGMATAGSGDVLTGVIAALLAQGYNAPDAARLGVYLHGMAGDLAASVVGEVSLTASDIVKYIPTAWNKMYCDK
ncbi:MAG: NAD(P)H-hydrate dehydratase, partial [Bacteroidaceae bacterium]|nr:NAD(P)H-hydrate dehydratase [Bacteroidaceae bacterium]